LPDHSDLPVVIGESVFLHVLSGQGDALEKLDFVS